MLGEQGPAFCAPKCGRGRGPVTPTVTLPDLADVLAVNPDLPASDPTIFHKRYLKKIRDLGEVRGLGQGPDCQKPTG